MDYTSLLEISTLLSNRFDTHWTLFISVHLALVGGIIYVDRPLDKLEKAAAIFVYTGFAAFNGLMMINQLQLLHSINLDIISFKDHACCTNLHSLAYLEQVSQKLSLPTQKAIVSLIHIFMYILVVLSILRDKARNQ